MNAHPARIVLAGFGCSGIATYALHRDGWQGAVAAVAGLVLVWLWCSGWGLDGGHAVPAKRYTNTPDPSDRLARCGHCVVTGAHSFRVVEGCPVHGNIR